MKIYCFIDSLGSGGAQRQLVALGLGLKKRGHEVRFLVYHDDDHFLYMLNDFGIGCYVITAKSYIKKILEVRRILKIGWQDVVLAFLEAPSFYAEIASIPKRKWRLIVGERLANPDMNKLGGLLLRQFHRFADVVVSNSHTNRMMLEILFPFLKRKLCTIYNTVDLKRFQPALENERIYQYRTKKEFRLVVIASYQKKKNMMNLAKALKIINTVKVSMSIVVHWYGAMPAGPDAYDEVREYLKMNGIERYFYMHHAIRNVEEEMSRADVVALFSFYEGLPNVVCEGMACGKPILISRVCDADNLVQDGRNGFLCDPESPEDIADKINCIASLSKEQRERMGQESRRMAEELFSEEKIVGRYEELILSVSDSLKIRDIENIPHYVPASAFDSINKWSKNV
ncbi:MAG TPA: glycosyltransferase [Campylobacterales bacterium]|nr:glycosyltransferase [Campylobacterales bacterium]